MNKENINLILQVLTLFITIWLAYEPKLLEEESKSKQIELINVQRNCLNDSILTMQQILIDSKTKLKIIDGILFQKSEQDELLENEIISHSQILNSKKETALKYQSELHNYKLRILEYKANVKNDSDFVREGQNKGLIDTIMMLNKELNN